MGMYGGFGMRFSNSEVIQVVISKVVDFLLDYGSERRVGE